MRCTEDVVWAGGQPWQVPAEGRTGRSSRDGATFTLDTLVTAPHSVWLTRDGIPALARIVVNSGDGSITVELPVPAAADVLMSADQLQGFVAAYNGLVRIVNASAESAPAIQSTGEVHSPTGGLR